MHACLLVDLPQRNELLGKTACQYCGHFPHAHTQTSLQATIDKTLISCQSTEASKHVEHVCVHVLRYMCEYVYTQCVCFILSVHLVWPQWSCSGKVSSAVCIWKSFENHTSSSSLTSSHFRHTVPAGSVHSGHRGGC